MESALAFAEAALARGDYSQSLNVLEELSEDHPLNTPEGSKIRMLMITALMGRGDEEKAISICRKLTHCRDNELRQSSKQLLSVLESPALARPANWSIQLPSLDITPLEGNKIYSRSKKSIQEKTEQLPPTGPTSGMGFGFLTVVLTILTGLTILLSGCVQVTTEIDLAGPDRVQLKWEIESNNGQLLPWQKEFENSLTNLTSGIDIFTTPEGVQKIKTSTLRSREANLMLQKTFSTAAESAGFEITPPILSLKEKNWLIGVYQDFKLIVDLKDLKQVPGVKLFVRINDTDNMYWQIQLGEVNILKFEQWQWNKLGLGIILIFSLLSLNLILQRIRLGLGFGFPELPP